MGQYISYLQILMKAYNSVRREVMYNVLTEFGTLIKLVRLIQICFIQTIVKSA